MKILLVDDNFVSRKLLPIFKKQKFGYLLITASAAGLLTHIDSITYSVTKHSAIAFAEWIAINNREHNFHVSVICPQAVRTNMTKGREKDVAALDGMLEPDVLVEKIQEGIDKKQFLILPHPEVQNYIDKKVTDVEFINNSKDFSHCAPISKESYFYRKIFESTFKNHENLIPFFFQIRQFLI